MKLIRYEKPEVGLGLSHLDDWFRNSDRFFDPRNWSGLMDWSTPDGSSSRGRYHLSADLYEDDDAYYARFELPGVKKEDVSLELHNAVLTVSYEKHTRSGENSESSETFTRSISVPDGINTEKISASHEDGLLTVTMPKSEAKKPRAIEVS